MIPERALFANLNAPTPWWPASNNARVISDAEGRFQVQVLPSGDPVRDHELALAIARLVNAHAGADVGPLEHTEALHHETQRAARQMGGRRS